MAKDKKTILFYSDWLSSYENLSDEEAGQLIKHKLRYCNDLNPEPPNRLIQVLFEPFKQHLKRDLRKYEEIKEKRSQAGKISAIKKAENSTSVNKNQQVLTHDEKSDTNSTLKDKDKDNVINNTNNSLFSVSAMPPPQKIIKAKFIKPQKDDLCALFLANRKSMSEAEKFYDYYEANGWRVGRNPMKDWMAAARNWIKNSNQFNKTPQNGTQLTKAEREQAEFNRINGTNFGEY